MNTYNFNIPKRRPELARSGAVHLLKRRVVLLNAQISARPPTPIPSHACFSLR
jgi:hypothetical protein